MPFERYSILLMLAQADNGELRPSELADALPITPSTPNNRLTAAGQLIRRNRATPSNRVGRDPRWWVDGGGLRPVTFTTCTRRSAARRRGGTDPTRPA